MGVTGLRGFIDLIEEIVVIFQQELAVLVAIDHAFLARARLMVLSNIDVIEIEKCSKTKVWIVVPTHGASLLDK